MKPLHNRIQSAASTPKGKAIVAGILLLLVIAVVLCIVYWNAIKEHLIRNQVKLKVREKTDWLYTIHYSKMEIDEVGGNLSISNLSLQYDSTRYLMMKAQKKEPPILFRMKIASIAVTGVQTSRALLTKEITGSKIRISYPVIEMYYTQAEKDTAHNIPADEAYRQMLGELESIRVDTLLIVGAQLITRNMQTGRQELRLTDTHMELRDVVVDSTSGRDSSRMIFSKQLSAACSTLLWSSPDGLYTYKAENIAVGSAKREIYAGRFRIIPALGEAAFTAKKNIQSDRFDIDIRQPFFHGVDFQQLMKKRLVTDSVVVSSASFNIFRDMTRSPDPRSKLGTYPHQKLARIPFPVKIRKIILNNSAVEYKEKGRLLQKTGKVNFDGIRAVISNITNDRTAPDKIATADIRARFLGRFPVQTSWAFYLFNTNGRFDVKGNLGALNAPAINSITEPLGGIRIKRGRIKRLDFNLKGYDYGMDGTVQLLYDDLKVAVLKKEKDAGILKEKKLASWGANMIIKDANPSAKEAPRLIHVHLDREINRSLFHLSWKTLLKGIKETVLPAKKKKVERDHSTVTSGHITNLYATVSRSTGLNGAPALHNL